MKKYFSNEALLKKIKFLMVDLYSKFPYFSPQSRYFEKFAAPNPVVLDVGVGEGTFMRMASNLRQNAKFFAVDIYNNIDAAIYNGECQFYACNLNKNSLPFEDDSFDYINCSHVIEHIKDPLALVNEMSRVCKPGGYVYIEAPDIRWTYLLRLPFLISDDGTYNFWDDPTHIRPYSRVALRKCVEMADMMAIKTFYARKWLHLLVLPLAFVRRKNDYKVAVLQAIFGLWCGVISRK